MAITQKVTFQMRRGDFEDFDKDELSSGEPAAVLMGDPDVPSGKAFYVCFQAGDVRRMVSIEDLEIMLERGDFKGDKGDTGDGISNVQVDSRSHLIVTLTSGKRIDAGYILEILEQINADEQKRIEAEKGRVAAEAQRNSAETFRESAELYRKEAEQTRVADENTRKANEDAREAQEAIRQSSENERQQAEQARISSESARNTQWLNNIKPAAEQAVIDANTAADRADSVADTLTEKLEAGAFKGEKGDKGDKGDSGITAPSAGMFSLWLEQETGDLYAYYPDGSAPPQFEFDAESGALYFVIDDGEG